MSRYKHSLSQQFRDRCINMSAWCERHDVSRSLLTHIAAGRLTGYPNGKSKKIIELLKKEGFAVETAEYKGRKAA